MFERLVGGEPSPDRRPRTYLTLDGRTVHVELTASVVHDRRGIPLNVAAQTIDVSAWDPARRVDGTATITAPDGTVWSLDLQPVAADRFEATITVPSNATASDVRYGATVAVHDDIGQESSLDAGVIIVAGTPPTASGVLTVSPSARVFGPLAPGGSLTRTVLVRNTGPPGSAAVEATVAVTGRSFVLGGDGTLVLEPGRTARLRITYSPDRAGVELGHLTVGRTDGRRPRLGTVLIGLAAGRLR